LNPGRRGGKPALELWRGIGTMITARTKTLMYPLPWQFLQETFTHSIKMKKSINDIPQWAHISKAVWTLHPFTVI
jgi:hypothetical protein